MPARYQDIGFEDFEDAPGFYKGTISGNSNAFRRLFELLNDPENEQSLISASEQELPALKGILQLVEAEPSISGFLETDTRRISRTTVGYVVREKMEKLGWRITCRKGSLPCSRFFTQAEIYEI